MWERLWERRLELGANTYRVRVPPTSTRGIDRRLNGLAGSEYDATISFGLPFEPEDSQYGKSRTTTLLNDVGGTFLWAHGEELSYNCREIRGWNALLMRGSGHIELWYDLLRSL